MLHKTLNLFILWALIVIIIALIKIVQELFSVSKQTEATIEKIANIEYQLKGLDIECVKEF